MVTIDPLADWWIHDVTVEPYLGTSGYGGDKFGPAVTYTGFVDDKRRMVRDATGTETTAESTIAFPKTVPPIPLGSRVTLPSVFGFRTTRVLASSIGDTGGRLPLDHAEYACS